MNIVGVVVGGGRVVVGGVGGAMGGSHLCNNKVFWKIIKCNTPRSRDGTFDEEITL